MKISKIEFENFRNFRDHGEIYCSTDGKVTIVYGRNGEGKTTMHQLFQWVIYGKVSFNKTATNKLYNLKYERSLPLNTTFDVFGRIEFEDGGTYYSLTRRQTYKKGIRESVKESEDFDLQMMTEDHDWKRIEKPQEVIERILPSGLSEYFFFDGENMIADLHTTGKESAYKLKKALYSVFELDTLEQAISHIGSTDKKTTVLGKLYLSKGQDVHTGEISKVNSEIQQIQAKISKLEDKVSELTDEKNKCDDLSKQISEQIGGTPSKSDYERRRKELKKHRDNYLADCDEYVSSFGKNVMDLFPYLLISEPIENAKYILQSKISKTKVPNGLEKTLIEHLLSDEADKCICGNPLCENEISHLKELLKLFPPKSYTNIYQKLNSNTQYYKSKYTSDYLDSIIKKYIEHKDSATKCDDDIHELDEREKNSPNIDNLIVDRAKAEEQSKKLASEIKTLDGQIIQWNTALKKKMKEYDSLTKNEVSNKAAQARIDIMQSVLEELKSRLDNQSIVFSQKLQECIQQLIEKMLTTKRNVVVNKDFGVVVKDSYNDESKSEGQFAVVSFAYIGGILKMLEEEATLSGKEYPLVLDGPFSKLDVEQRSNVALTIPEFAPQIILFSKDDLSNVFDENKIGKVWTIESNDEKNVASVKEGMLWK